MKDEVSEKFKEFKALVKNLSKKNINTLRSDNGGEFTSKEFKDLCKEVGVKRDLTTPYSPQQNGVIERNNRSIMEAVKAMIHYQYLPMHLWDDATKTEVYVQNKISHSSLGKKILEEMFTGEKPEVIHMKIFGCPVYLDFCREKISKLNPSIKKVIFVRYSDQSKDYRIYIPSFC